MAAVALIGVLAIGFMAGFVVAVRFETRKTVDAYLRQVGLTKDVAKRYRDAAKILHDLIYVKDLEELVPILPAPMQKRIEDWLTAHKKAIEEGE